MINSCRQRFPGTTLDEALEKLGAVDPDSPKTVNLYAATFEDKEAIADNIAEYNRNADEDKAIEYTDYVALLMSGVTTMIDAVSYGLIAFVAISLVVSSIMIGIITYISVLERTKEIGILRSIGASKRDISSVFNAETLIIGFCAGAIGIIASMLLCIPLNLIVRSLTGIDTLTAVPSVACRHNTGSDKHGFDTYCGHHTLANCGEEGSRCRAEIGMKQHCLLFAF